MVSCGGVWIWRRAGCLPVGYLLPSRQHAKQVNHENFAAEGWIGESNKIAVIIIISSNAAVMLVFTTTSQLGLFE